MQFHGNDKIECTILVLYVHCKKKISSEAVKNCNAKREIDEPKLETALFLVCTNGDYKPKKDTLHLNATEKR